MNSGPDFHSIGSLLKEHFSGAWGSDPGRASPNTTVLRSTDIDDDGHVDLSTGAQRHLSPRDVSSRQLRPGDTLLEASGGGPGKPVGRPAWFSDEAQAGHYATSNFFKVLRPDTELVDAKFLLYGLVRLVKRPEIWRFQQQTTGITNLKFSDYLKHEIAVPPLMEQRRTVEILDTLDDQIRLTECAVAKLQVTFVGLLCRLLTQGMQSDAASLGNALLEFGEGSIRLPKHWTMEPIGQLLGSVDPAMRSGPFGSALLKHELVESGVPLLGIDNVHVDQFVSDFRRFVTPSKAVELSRYRVRPADVMITIMGTVGRSCLVPEDIGLALSSKHVWTLTFDDARYRPYLASLQLNHAPWARAHLRRDEQGGIMSAIRSDTLKTLMLPTPPIDEQLEIEAILKTLESKIANQEQSLTKLRTLKAGLAEDLLTGRVRAPEEVAS